MSGGIENKVVAPRTTVAPCAARWRAVASPSPLLAPVMPRRFIAGADAIATAEQKVADLKAQIDPYRELSMSLDFDEVGSART